MTEPKYYKISDEDVSKIKLIFQDYISWHGRIHALDRLNEILKSIPKIKYLNGEEVTEIIIDLLDDKIETKEAIDKICSLAIPEDNKLMQKIKRLEANEKIYHRRLKEAEDKGEVIAEGEVDTVEYGEDGLWDVVIGDKSFNDDPSYSYDIAKYKGKKVRIKVEEVK